MSYTLIRTDEYKASLTEIERGEALKIDKKIEQLAHRPFMGDRLVDSPFFKIHVGKYRVIYDIRRDIIEIFLVEILQRKHNYRELKKIEEKYRKKYHR